MIVRALDDRVRQCRQFESRVSQRSNGEQVPQGNPQHVPALEARKQQGCLFIARVDGKRSQVGAEFARRNRSFKVCRIESPLQQVR